MIGCNSKVIDSPPEIGSIITIKHCDYFKNGTLRHPYFWRITTNHQENNNNNENSFFFTTKWSHIPKLMVFFNTFKKLKYLGKKSKLELLGK